MAGLPENLSVEGLQLREGIELRNGVDEEWVRLMIEAKAMGLTVKEIASFLTLKEAERGELLAYKCLS